MLSHPTPSCYSKARTQSHNSMLYLMLSRVKLYDKKRRLHHPCAAASLEPRLFGFQKLFSFPVTIPMTSVLRPEDNTFTSLFAVLGTVSYHSGDVYIPSKFCCPSHASPLIDLGGAEPHSSPLQTAPSPELPCGSLMLLHPLKL